MPNLVLEYSNSVEERVNVPGLLEDLHQVMLDSGLFDVLTVKSRTLRCHHWLIGTQADSEDFVYLSVEVMTGYTPQQKQTLSQQLMTVLNEQAPQVRSLSVSIRELDQASVRNVMH